MVFYSLSANALCAEALSSAYELFSKLQKKEVLYLFSEKFI